MSILFRKRAIQTGWTRRSNEFEDELDGIRPAGRTLEGVTIGITVELLGAVDTYRVIRESCPLIKAIERDGSI